MREGDGQLVHTLPIVDFRKDFSLRRGAHDDDPGQWPVKQTHLRRNLILSLKQPTICFETSFRRHTKLDLQDWCDNKSKIEAPECIKFNGLELHIRKRFGRRTGYAARTPRLAETTSERKPNDAAFNVISQWDTKTVAESPALSCLVYGENVLKVGNTSRERREATSFHRRAGENTSRRPGEAKKY